MILYEFEGKKLLQQAGINIPKGQLVNKDSLASFQNDITIQTPLVLKAQVLSGKRAEAGGIVKVDNQQLLGSSLEELFGKTINSEKVEKVLVEELIEYFGPEYYLSISYDTDTRGPILTVSESGGTGVEKQEVKAFQIDPLTETIVIPPSGIQKTESTWISDLIGDNIIKKLIKLFFDEDCLLLEINPLVKSKNEWIALDAKVKLDDDARSRHEDWSTSWWTPRSAPGHNPTQNEIEAKKIDQGDYRGTAGSAYFDLDGDIAILSSGGGVSLTAMDALINFGGKPANFTEYSGNPPKEKVVKLTKIVLNKQSLRDDGSLKPNIHGLWIIGTVAANFTDIYETLLGIVEALREVQKETGKQFGFPIIVRRGGPNQEQAYEMLRGVKDLNLILQGEETSITESAKVMTKEAKKYASTS